jgi:hypothetical protein
VDTIPFLGILSDPTYEVPRNTLVCNAEENRNVWLHVAASLLHELFKVSSNQPRTAPGATIRLLFHGILVILIHLVLVLLISVSLILVLVLLIPFHPILIHLHRRAIIVLLVLLVLHLILILFRHLNLGGSACARR